MARWIRRVVCGFYPFPSSFSGPVDPLLRALSGRLEFTVRRHKFDKDSRSQHLQMRLVRCPYTRDIQGQDSPRLLWVPPPPLKPPDLFDTMYLLISFRKSTPPHTCQLNVFMSNSKQEVDDFMGILTL